MQTDIVTSTARDDLATRLPAALSSCMTEADIVQVLYAELHREFGYDVINLHVLEREGRLHALVVDHGVLQDVKHHLLAESSFAEHYGEPRPRAGQTTDLAAYSGRGPGARKRPQTYIWVPIFHRGQTIGSVIYQLDERREVPHEEVELLERVHSQLGVVVSNAYLNELTRNQAVRLTALNAIARALAGTHDAEGVAAALYSTLAPLIPIDGLDMVVDDGSPGGRLRLLQLTRGENSLSLALTRRSARLAALRGVLDSGRSELEQPTRRGRVRSAARAPILEQGRVRGVLSIESDEPGAYEESTIAFLEQVADEVSLALRNARSYAALESQRRRLEVVNVVGRSLASNLDRWSIVRTLRQELSRHLDFDIFSIATVEEAPEGSRAQAYVYDSGEERELAPVPLAAAGPAREAYEKGEPVLIRRSPWARSFESGQRQDQEQGVLTTQGAVMYVTRSGKKNRRIAARSIVWVPVRHGQQITALLSLQSYRADAFDEWHVQLLQDVAAHVSLALSTAAHFEVAQAERRRLEALHVLEMAAAGAADERELAEAIFKALGSPVDASYLALVYLDGQRQLTGYACAPNGEARPLPPRPLDRTRYFRRLMEEAATVAEATPPELDPARPFSGWEVGGTRIPRQVLWVPLLQDGRVIGALSAQRHDDRPFTATQVELLESAAPVVSIILRTIRLHRSNELALSHSVRIQEVSALAGHDLESVVASVAEQARPMLEAIGTACWAFDDDGRVGASGSTGLGAARSVLGWSGWTAGRPWKESPSRVLGGNRGTLDWNLIPLWYGDRLVGALGAVRPQGGVDPTAEHPVDFARHAAIAIESARLVAETRGRIRTLEAVAGLANLDITRPERARLQMGRLVEQALSGSNGALWLVEGDEVVRAGRGTRARRLPLSELGRLLAPVRSRTLVRPVRGMVRPALATGLGAFVSPIVVDGPAVGMVTSDAGSSAAETRRLMAVLAGQTALVLGRLQLVGELDRQARMLATILRHSPVGVVLEDAGGHVVYANPEIERIYGVDAARLGGTPAGWLLEQAGATPAAESEPDGGGPLELRLAERGVIVRVRRVPIPGSEEQPARVLTLHEDVTQEHMVLEAKDLMLRAIGHEVRSPAAAIRSTIAGLLQWGELVDAERRRALVEEAYEQSNRLLSLVESQLIIAKLETRHFEPNTTEVDLEGALQGVVGVLRNRYGSRVASVHFDLDPELPDAYCDPIHLDQVLSNLIGNALEYTPGHRVRVSARPQDDWLEVTVADEGGGLPPEHLPTLFQKTGAGRNRARSGLGLGLYLCRLVVERSFGGRIWLDQTGPDGTVFRFTVPARALVRPRAVEAMRMAR
jgi:signal transduction histidine kinase/transcriptional regulator with GAF, ATPase, and Fis domain